MRSGPDLDRAPRRVAAWWRATSRRNRRAPIEHRWSRGEGLAGWAIEHEQPLRLAPGEPRPELSGPTPPFRSALVIPLFRRGEAFGAIECLDKVHGEAFTDADFDRLEMASEHIAFALDNALLYEETERRALEKEVLLEVSKTISTPLDLESVIDAIFKSLHQVVDYDAAAIYLVNRKTQALELVSQVGYPAGLARTRSRCRSARASWAGSRRPASR